MFAFACKSEKKEENSNQQEIESKNKIEQVEVIYKESDVHGKWTLVKIEGEEEPSENRNLEFKPNGKFLYQKKLALKGKYAFDLESRKISLVPDSQDEASLQLLDLDVTDSTLAFTEENQRLHFKKQQ